MLLKLHRKQKSLYIATAVFLLIIEVLIERYVHDNFVRPYLGDLLVVILIYAIVMACSKIKVWTGAIATLLFSYAVETAQYLQLVNLLGLEENKFARIVIGTSFSWWDMLMYTLGFITVIILEKTISMNSN
ncbi:DUF2809 domain-containing protein [Nonlabens sp. Asnod2-A12]|uniref:ribosomal maturation YjgA family protein n=1 Tax=Nonlabens sp. Asnod2-A12 TaxID=3160578 RepID=UPI003866E01F